MQKRFAGVFLVACLAASAAFAQGGPCKETREHKLDVSDNGVIHVCTAWTTFIIRLSTSEGWCKDVTTVTPAYSSCDGPPSNEVRCVFVNFVQQTIISTVCDFKSASGHSLKVGGVKISLGAGEVGCKSTSMQVQGPRDYMMVADKTCAGTVSTPQPSNPEQ